MALSTLAQLKHRQLLYGVSTRLSKENVKDMIYLTCVEQHLQQSISSGIDLFTILEQKGLLSEHNYGHLISLLETIGRIDLIEIVCLDHQATSVIALPPNKFSIAEQLGIMKRAQILQKRDIYIRSMQKLDTLCKSTSVHQQMTESYIMHTLSVLQIPDSETDSIYTSLKYFDDSVVGDLLRSASLFCRSMHDSYHLFLVGETREFECLVVLCHQHWNEFYAKLPKDCAPLTESLQQVHLVEHNTDSLIWQTVTELHQSLHDIFSELLETNNLLTDADTSFNTVIVNGQSFYNSINYMFPIIKWSTLLFQAVKQGNVNVTNHQDTVLIFASNYRQLFADNADVIAKHLGQDFLDRIIQLIPQNNKASPESSSNTEIPNSRNILFSQFGSMCLALLVQASTSTNPQTELQSLKTLLPALRKALMIEMAEGAKHLWHMTKKADIKHPKGSAGVQEQVRRSDRNNGWWITTVSRNS